ncbi:hypothetical protein QTI24_29300 [Variovorax sp. J22P240]|uniref:hypothetical protein n=1 Tax=Variovorax sp. J22P240 TaxID=3053514 RepID=UPI00257575B6|nr:hypothetical protein [Variovorax sp. J22P240]MDM0002728.1 hypothetical protein [Variovorax sp. J22P240]
MTTEAAYSNGCISFAIYPDGAGTARVVARITEEALQDHFRATGSATHLMQVFGANQATIVDKALERFAQAPGFPVLLRSADF